MGANGPYQQTHCHRGHPLEGANIKPQLNGRRCRACERALSWAYNSLHRQGIERSLAEVQAHADWQYDRLRAPR